MTDDEIVEERIRRIEEGLEKLAALVHSEFRRVRGLLGERLDNAEAGAAAIRELVERREAEVADRNREDR